MDSKIFRVIIVSMLTISLCPSEKCFAIEFSALNLKLHKKVKSVREIRDHNVVRQSTDYSCGAAGLSTILNYDLHDPIGEREIIAGLLKTTDIQKVKARQGFSLLDLKLFAQQRGYKVTGYKMDIDFLRSIDKPVLVPIRFKNYRHFIIVKGVLGERVFVSDPAMGNMIIKVSWFEKIWQDGIGLVIEERLSRNPFKPYATSDLTVKNEDVIMVDGQSIKRSLQPNNGRTSVFATEF